MIAPTRGVATPEAGDMERRAPGGGVVAELIGVSKQYGAEQVFHGLDAAFTGGRLTVVTGPSGSGKTTLLHLLAGLDVPTSGEVLVEGASVPALDPERRAELRRSQIALVTQGAELVSFLSARENVELALTLRGMKGGEDEALAAVGLAELAGQRVSRLSTGERQRVALARAIASRPALLLADEPTARLDEANARAVGLLFSRLAAESGTAVVCATHDHVLTEHADAEIALGEREAV